MNLIISLETDSTQHWDTGDKKKGVDLELDHGDLRRASQQTREEGRLQGAGEAESEERTSPIRGFGHEERAKGRWQVARARQGTTGALCVPVCLATIRGPWQHLGGMQGS